MVRKLRKKGKKPTFFRFIIAGFNTKHLHIPDDFLHHISKDLSKKATLKLKDLSSNSSWTVEVVKTKEGAVHFKEGWMEFLQENSLLDNAFLVFRYEGNMHFSIKIFEKFGHKRADYKQKRPLQLSSSDEDDSVVNISSSESSHLKETEEDKEDSEEDTFEDPKSYEPETFQSSFPHFFCHIKTTRCKMQYIPASFSKNHFPRGKDFWVVMKNAKGKKWDVKALPLSGSHIFSAGWSAFSYANRIREGDTCVFELLGKNKMMVRILEKASV